MNPPSGEFPDRIYPRLHAVLLCILLLGIAAWLFRTYGFEPLEFKPAAETVSP